MASTTQSLEREPPAPEVRGSRRGAREVGLGTYAHLFDTVTERIDLDQAIRAARYGTGADQERAAG
jgi:hypothetical protein